MISSGYPIQEDALKQVKRKVLYTKNPIQHPNLVKLVVLTPQQVKQSGKSASVYHTDLYTLSILSPGD